MSNVASLDLCKELYELSGWDDKSSRKRHIVGGNAQADDTLSQPYYTLSFLLEKLPKNVTDFWGRAYPASPCLMFSGTEWVIFYQSTMTGEHNTDELFGQFAHTPEDAAAKLAIELFKQGVLK